MARTASITLDGQKYTVHAFNIGELEKITQSGNNAWAVLRIAMERAEPKVADPNALEPTQDEVREAFTRLLSLAGLQQSDANPQVVDGQQGQP